MPDTRSRKPLSREERPLTAGRGFRLLFCAFLFTAAAVCKNVLPADWRQALVTGLDAGVGVREILENLGSPEQVMAAAERLWNGGILRVFNSKDGDQPVSAGEEDAGIPETDARTALAEETSIPVFSHRAVDIEAELPPPSRAADPEPGTAEEMPETDGGAAEETAPEEDGVLLSAYVLPSSDTGLPVPDAVCREAVRVTLDYVSPVRGTLTSGFGYRSHPIDGVYKFHYGVDLAVPQGTEVLCFADGEVTFAGWGDINGNYVRVAHEDGLETLYAHLDSIAVKTGDRVSMGEVLGASGATGEASGPHLHFQLYSGGRLTDPAPLLEYAA